MSDATCSIEECDESAIARSWCWKHYQRWRRTGEVTRPKRPTTCSVTGCDRKVAARDWCWRHYRRWRAYGDPEAGQPFRHRIPGPVGDDSDGRCGVDGCDNESNTRGWCRMHYGRFIRDGSPGEAETRQPGRSINTQGYIAVVAHGHPLADKNGRTLEHRIVLWEKLEHQDAPCHWCDHPLVWLEDLVTDHLDHDRQNNDPENLVPSCSPCNVKRRRPSELLDETQPV